MLISSLIGKQIFTPEGTPYGYIFDALLTKNRKRLSHLVCADGEEKEFFLPERAVLEIGERVTVNPVRENPPAAYSPLPTGKPVYDDEGTSYGFASDVDVGEDGVSLLTTKNARLPLARLKFGDAVLYRPERKSEGAKKPADQTAKKSAPKRTKSKEAEAPAPAEETQTPAPQAEAPENPLPMSEPPASVSPQSVRAPVSRPAPQPVNAGLYRLNLLGRKVNRDVFDGDGKPIARAGEKITAKVLAEARRSNMLLKLTVNTLTDDTRFT